MKKIISIILGILLFCSCENGHIGQVNSPIYPLKKATEKEQMKFVQENIMVITVFHEGEFHEYVCSGISRGQYFNIGGHWEGCKFCKYHINEDNSPEGMKLKSQILNHELF